MEESYTTENSCQDFESDKILAGISYSQFKALAFIGSCDQIIDKTSIENFLEKSLNFDTLKNSLKDKLFNLINRSNKETIKVTRNIRISKSTFCRLLKIKENKQLFETNQET